MLGRMQWMQIRRIGRRMQLATTELPGIFMAVQTAASACAVAIELLEKQMASICERGIWAELESPTQELTDADIKKLIKLNQQLKKVEQFIEAFAHANGNEFECHIQYLASQGVALSPNRKRAEIAQRQEIPIGLLGVRGADFAERWSGTLGPEPYCYLFHDLIDHDYGDKSKKATFQESVRIDAIRLTMEMTQQFTLVLSKSNASQIDAQ